MDTQTRRRVAYIAGRLARSSTASSIYDYQASQHFPMSGEITPSNVSVFDYTTSSHMSGNSTGNGRFSIFDYANSKHLDLSYNSGTFEGFDYATSTHFNGKASSNGDVNVYDYGTGQYYSYSML